MIDPGWASDARQRHVTRLREQLHAIDDEVRALRAGLATFDRSAQISTKMYERDEIARKVRAMEIG